MANKQRDLGLLFFVAALLLAALACGPGLDVPEVDIPQGAAATAAGMASGAATALAEVTIPPGARQTAEALGRAGATAVAEAGQQGGAAVATLQASDFDLNIDIVPGPLQETIRNATPDANGNLVFTFSDDQINEAIQARAELDGQLAQATLRNVVVAFTGGNIVLTGDLTEPVQAQLVATFRPAVVDGRIQVELVSASLGPLPLPTALLSQAETSLNNALSDVTASLPEGYRLQQLTMNEGSMTVVASR